MTARVVSGIFASRREAEAVRSHLLEHGLPREQVDVVERVRADDDSRESAEADRVLKDVLIDSAVGTLVGTALGALGEAALVAANLTLFAASPFVAPVAMLGWGAAIGAVIGGAIGAGGMKKDGKFSALVLHAIRSGHVTLIAHTRTDEENQLASRVIGPSVIERSEQRSVA
jgi:hypothetical protein